MYPALAPLAATAVAEVHRALTPGRPVPSADVAGLPDATLEMQLRACAALRARLDALEATLVSEHQRRDLAIRSGARDTTEWLSRHAMASSGSARARVDLAGTSAAVPGVAGALAAGEISADHVRALGRAVEETGGEAVAADSERLVAAARRCDPGRFSRRVRTWILDHHRDRGSTGAEARHKTRSATVSHDRASGATHVHAELFDDEGALVAGVLRSLVEEAWRAERGADAELPGIEVVTNRQRLADAVVEMARRCVGATAAMGRRVPPTVIVQIDHATLLGQLDAAGIATLADGSPIPAATARRLACEANLLPVVLSGRSEPLDLGRSQRVASAAQRNAMRARSQTCEFSGCTIPADYCEAHHLDWWELGGRTDIEKLAWLCGSHHHLTHDGGWTLERRADGRLECRPPPLGRAAPAVAA